MSMHLYRLTDIHARIDDEIRRERRHHIPDAIRLMRLKKLKLVIKDRLHVMMTRMNGKRSAN